MDKVEKIGKELTSLHTIGGPGIKFSAVASRDGILIKARVDKHAEVLSAMAATILEATEILSTYADEETPEELVVKAKRAKIIILGAGPKALLLVITQPETSIPQKIKETAENIKEILG